MEKLSKRNNDTETNKQKKAVAAETYKHLAVQVFVVFVAVQH